MKILHVIPTYVPAYRYGGPVHTTHELCKELVKKGHEVLVVTTDEDMGKKLDVKLNQIQNVDGVDVIYHRITFPKFYHYSNALAMTIRKNISRFDVVHIHSVYLYPTFIASSLCRQHNKPYIINPFGALDPSMINLKNKIKKMFYLWLIERHNIEMAEVITVASEYERIAFRSLGLKTSTAVVPRGIDLKKYEINESSKGIKEKYPFLIDKKILLFLGRIHPKKGLDLLARSFKEVLKYRKDVYLIIAGTGEDGYLGKIKKLFDELEISPNIIFTGMLLGDQKISFLNHSDIFILTSYGENFGFSILEAMACRTPVITTNCVGLACDVDKHKAGIITGCNIKEITGAVIALLDDENLRKTMGMNGRRLVESKYALDDVVDRMISVYAGILKTQDKSNA